ncbi:hypothetical protein KAYACHO_86 [Mycobacterium phage KayaCho]|uniref:hypothetical protein n=1 Tax=Mycobacterium phage KayaCho TaxID=1340830 RepID=UPI000387E22C|nr:hypothetical protein N846_gp86 [Mycobacterium phage KayaCho]AGT12990.1 hypothetical protein KAYACHO_86 [Mycobacterium phage KayaCho]
MSAAEADGPKYPEVEVELIGQDGNGFLIVSKVQRALRQAGVPADEVTAYVNEATDGDYDDLLATTMRWITVR